MPLDIDAAIKALDANVQPGPTGKCATHVRKALEAGGLDLSVRPVSAKDYGPTLKTKGLKSAELKNYQPLKGDIVVIQSYQGGDPHGHIAMYNGTQWVSDFKQRDMWGGPGYRKNTPNYEVFRP
jgi:type VI secretion system secreted protein VgrG